jgi:hypothetical protein
LTAPSPSILSCAGSSPEFNTRARSSAALFEYLPVISPESEISPLNFKVVHAGRIEPRLEHINSKLNRRIVIVLAVIELQYYMPGE